MELFVWGNIEQLHCNRGITSEQNHAYILRDSNLSHFTNRIVKGRIKKFQLLSLKFLSPQSKLFFRQYSIDITSIVWLLVSQRQSKQWTETTESSARPTIRSSAIMSFSDIWKLALEHPGRSQRACYFIRH